MEMYTYAIQETPLSVFSQTVLVLKTTPPSQAQAEVLPLTQACCGLRNSLPTFKSVFSTCEMLTYPRTSLGVTAHAGIPSVTPV